MEFILNSISFRGRGFCVVKNDLLSVSDFMELLSNCLGDTVRVSDSANHNLTYDIVRDRGANVVKANNIPLLSASNSFFPLHTDCSYLEKPVDIVILYCVENSEIGGDSLLLNFNDVVRYLPPDYLKFLCDRAFSFRSHIRPVLEKRDNLYLIRYHMGEILAGIGDTDRTSVCDDLKYLSDLLSVDTHYTSLKLCTNECLIINNRTTLHGRLSFEANSSRTFYRLRQYFRDYGD